MRILILGGTSDARKVVGAMDKRGLLDNIAVIYSVAGLVRVPELACDVISGGFSQRGGLLLYLQKEQIDLVLDITHPFALKMSTTAVKVCAEAGIPCWRFHRPAWQAQSGDQWRLFNDCPSLLAETKRYKSILLTAGQMEQVLIDQLSAQALMSGQRQVIRTAALPQATLPDSMQWLKAIGPFNEVDEKRLLEQHQIDLLVSKNSGGVATEAKLSAARELGIPVFMLERPALPDSDVDFSTVDDCVDQVEQYYSAVSVENAKNLNNRQRNHALVDVKYEMNPQAIEQESFRQIRALTDLDTFNVEQQQVVMRVVHSIGIPEVAREVRFSAQACESGIAALTDNAEILCDVEMVKQGITKRMISQPPSCYLNDPRAIELAKETGETRSMAAVELWRDKLAGSVVVIGNAPTALFRLLEMIEKGADKPALIIGMPVGFVGAAESKQLLWDIHQRLGIECITLLGRQGGSAVSAASCNALLRCIRGEYY